MKTNHWIILAVVVVIIIGVVLTLYFKPFMFQKKSWVTNNLTPANYNKAFSVMTDAEITALFNVWNCYNGDLTKVAPSDVTIYNGLVVPK